MTVYQIKYEDYRGNVFVENISAHDERQAKERLKHPYKEIYWIRKELTAEQIVNNLR